MARPHRIPPVLGGVVLWSVLLAPAAPVVPESVQFGGVARDLLGRVLPDVEIVVFPSEGPLQSLAVSRTDGLGRFGVPGLAPGTYRVAALKPGYLAAVGSIDTAIRSSLDFVLRPAPQIGEPGHERVRADLTWILRLPERSVLRDLEPYDPDPEQSGSRPTETASAGTGVQGEVRHSIAMGGAGTGPASGSALRGGDTSMKLSRLIGERGNISLVGRRQSFDYEDESGVGSTSGHRESSSVLMDFSYDTGADAILDVRAYYARDGALLGVPADAPALDDRRAHTSWGYDATWTKQLDRASRLAVEVGFVDASLDVATGLVESRLASPGGPADTTTLNNRAAEAEGRYESLAAEGHAIRVAARAQLLDLAIPLVRGERETLFLGIPGAAGLSVRVDVDDTWTLAPRVSLDYGLGVVQAVDGAASTLLVPRVGARWGTGRWHVAGVASYHDVAASPEPNVSIAQVGLLQPAEPWGYEGEIEGTLSERTKFRAFYTYNPLQDGRDRGDVSWTDGRPLFLTGANAADRTAGFLVEWSGPSVRARARWASGTASGLLAGAAGWGLPLAILAERTVSHVAGDAGVRVPASGTDVVLGFRKLAEVAGGEAGGVPVEPLVAEFLELTLDQHLVRWPRSGASCRLLMSARRSVGAGDADPDETSRALTALNDRVTAGVIVAF